MNIDKLKVGLASKVDSFEKWKELAALAGFNPERPVISLPEYGYRMRFPADRDYGELGNPNHLPVQSRWWMEREALRAAHGVYPEVTSVLENLVNSFGLQQHFIHISAEDPNMVAYTASVEDGQRDKQVRLSFGKLIRKLYCASVPLNFLMEKPMPAIRFAAAVVMRRMQSSPFKM